MGDGDFVKFIASMVCNVGKRKSAIELLRKKSKQNQLSWLRSDAAEISAGASPVTNAHQSPALGDSPVYPKEEAQDEEFCQTLLKHAVRVCGGCINYFPTYIYNKEVERWLQQTGSAAPTVQAYVGTMAGNTCGKQGYRSAQVRKICILHVEMQRLKAEEIVQEAKLETLSCDMTSF